MIRVSSTEFGKEVGRHQDAALTQPVVVTRNSRDRHVFVPGELPEETIEAIRNVKMDPRHNHLDELIKDWNL